MILRVVFFDSRSGRGLDGMSDARGGVRSRDGGVGRRDACV